MTDEEFHAAGPRNTEAYPVTLNDIVAAMTPAERAIWNKLLAIEARLISMDPNEPVVMTGDVRCITGPVRTF